MNIALRSMTVAGAAALAVTLASCSFRSDGLTGAEVAGKVTLDGKPFAGGTVVFAGPTDAATAEILPDGSYRASNVPLGPVRVVIVTSGPSSTKSQSGRGPAVQPAAPARYRDAKTSGLSLTVAEGDQVFDVPMKTR
jgi:hypothetical protein